MLDVHGVTGSSPVLSTIKLHPNRCRCKKPRSFNDFWAFCAHFFKRDKKMPKWALANSMDLYLYPRLFEPLFRGFFGEAALFCSQQNVEFRPAFLLVLPNTHSKHRCRRVSPLCGISDVKTAGKPPHSRTKSQRIGDAGTRESKTPAASAAGGRLSVGSQQSIGF